MEAMAEAMAALDRLSAQTAEIRRLLEAKDLSQASQALAALVWPVRAAAGRLWDEVERVGAGGDAP